MTPEQSLIAVRIMRAAFPSQRMDEYTPDAWAKLFLPHDFPEIEEAIASLASKQPFASVAEVLAEVSYTKRERAIRRKNATQLHALEAARSEAASTSATIAHDACRAAFNAVIATRISNCELCDDSGYRLTPARKPSHEKCNHRKLAGAPRDPRPAATTTQGGQRE